MGELDFTWGNFESGRAEERDENTAIKPNTTYYTRYKVGSWLLLDPSEADIHRLINDISDEISNYGYVTAAQKTGDYLLVQYRTHSYVAALPAIPLGYIVVAAIVVLGIYFIYKTIAEIGEIFPDWKETKWWWYAIGAGVVLAGASILLSQIKSFREAPT